MDQIGKLCEGVGVPPPASAWGADRASPARPLSSEGSLSTQAPPRIAQSSLSCKPAEEERVTGGATAKGEWRPGPVLLVRGALAAEVGPLVLSPEKRKCFLSHQLRELKVVRLQI